MQSHSGELGTVPEPNTFMTQVFVSHPDFGTSTYFQRFPKISKDKCSAISIGGEGVDIEYDRWHFFQDDVKWEGVKRSNELCNHNAENVRIGEKDLQVRICCRWISWCDSLSGPRETTRWGLVHGASFRHQPLWVFHGWRRSSQVSSTRHSSGFRQYLHFNFLFLTKSGTDSTLPQAMSREVSSVSALPSAGLLWGYMFNILTSVLLL